MVLLFLTLGISAIPNYLIISAGTMSEYALVAMWSPGIAAILTQLLFRKSLRGFGWAEDRLQPAPYQDAGDPCPAIKGAPPGAGSEGGGT